MRTQSSPLRLLARTYANDLISREQYIEIRAQLLKRLEIKGSIDESDLKNFTAITQDADSAKTQRYWPTYSTVNSAKTLTLLTRQNITRSQS
jgi:hypothetical protein